MIDPKEPERKASLQASLAPPGASQQKTPVEPRQAPKPVELPPSSTRSLSFWGRICAVGAGFFAALGFARSGKAQVANQPTFSQVSDNVQHSKADSWTTIDITLTPGVPPRTSPDAEELHKRLDEIKKAVRQPTVVLMKDAPEPKVERSEDSIELLKLLVEKLPDYGNLLVSYLLYRLAVKKSSSSEKDSVTINVKGKDHNILIESDESVAKVEKTLQEIPKADAMEESTSSEASEE